MQSTTWIRGKKRNVGAFYSAPFQIRETTGRLSLYNLAKRKGELKCSKHEHSRLAMLPTFFGMRISVGGYPTYM